MKIFLLLTLVLFLMLFLRDFQLFNRKAWTILLGLSGIGGFFSFQFMKKNGFIKTLESRRREIQEYRNHYLTKVENQDISEKSFNERLLALSTVEKDAYLSVLKASGLYKIEISANIQEMDAKALYEMVYGKISDSTKLK